MLRLAPIAFLLALPGFAGTEPKASAAEYPKTAKLPSLDIGAEYLARLIPGGFFAGDYIVFEVALFPDRRKEIDVAHAHFRLRVNGSDYPQLTQSPSSVAGGLRNPYREGYRGPQASVGMGRDSIILGGPERTERFPGDPQARQPRRPEAPDPNKPPANPQAPPLQDYEAAMQLALDEGRTTMARSGLIYFHWKEHLKKIKTLELIYEGPVGKASLAIR